MSAYRFDRYELFPESRRLLLDGRDVAVGLRVFDVIAYLVQNRRRAVGRDELIAAVWGRSDAGEALLAQAILKARRVFGDDGEAQHHIRTVPRFGYQWIASTRSCETGAETDVTTHADATPTITDETPPAPPATQKDRRPRSRRTRLLLLAAAFLIASVVVIAIGLHRHRRQRQADDASMPSIPGLILVLPADVQGQVAEDGWMRLGLMSLSAQALADAPDHAVVPDETALAAVARAGPARAISRLREETGASIVIVTEATRSKDAWQLQATVFDAAGGKQIVSADAVDPVVAGGALAHNLRELFAPDDPVREGGIAAPEVVALAARMKAAILEGQNGRALALLEHAPATVTTAPEVVLLRAEALTQLGRTGEAASALRALADNAGTEPAPRWLSAAWTALGDCELADGRTDQADAYFRRALAQPSSDRRSIGLAWRGLAIAQAVRNDLDGAEASFLSARMALEPIGDRLVLGRVMDGLGYVAAQRGHLADALLRYQQATGIAAAIGANETELGSRLNIAQSHEYLLQHSVALEQLRALLPRLRGLDYPTLHRFGMVSYIGVLVESGAFQEARGELARLAAESAPGEPYDAVVDVRLDTARARLALGDAAGAAELAGSIRAGLDEHSPADLRLETAALLLAALSGHDDASAAQLAADAAIWQPTNALAPARAHALTAQARWHAGHGDDATATAQFAQALALARDFGAPVVLRDAVVPFAEYQLAHGQVDAAAGLARALGPYADDDFASALLLARVAAMRGDAVLARSWFVKARQLAGERWSPALEHEAAATVAVPGIAKTAETQD